MTTNAIIRAMPKAHEGVSGLTFPAFIHNFDTFYFTELDTYADGVVDCWGAVDLEFLAKKFASGWISSQVPDNGSISIHDVIDATVVQSEWYRTPQQLHEALLKCIRQLNPSDESLIDFEGDDVEVRDGIRYAKIGLTKAFPVQKERGAMSSAGKSRYAFVRHDGQVFLTAIRIYADGRIDVHPRYGHEQLVDRGTFEAMVASNDITVTAPNGTSIEIDTLGRFEVTEVWSYIKRRKDFIKEVTETIGELEGRADSLAKCREAFQQYMDAPTVKNREALKQAYEAVPEHRRLYVGDMDTKDTAVRMIIYGEDEIEGWSHRAVARSQGEEELPTIDVPRPIDEEKS